MRVSGGGFPAHAILENGGLNTTNVEQRIDVAAGGSVGTGKERGKVPT